MSKLNQELADLFKQLAKQVKSERYRSRAYRVAAENIENHDRIIESGAQAQREIKGVGKSIAAKIDEIINTGQLSIIEDRTPEELEKEKTILLFEGIYGVGPVKAEEWYKAGFRSLEDLKQIYHTFTDGQKLGYCYYKHLNQRIPREEMDKYKELIDEISKKLEFEYEICGSYRRGETSSGDIDCLIKNSPNADLASIIKYLTKKGYLVGHLAVGKSKYMGIIRLSDQTNARRIDMLVISETSWPYATLYFTGSKRLNVIMRSKANELGLSMNEYRMINHRNEEYPAKTEEDIFKYLNMTYLKPTERSIGSK